MLDFEIFNGEEVELILFSPALEVEKDDIADIIERTLEKYHRPDKLLFIFPESDNKFFQDNLRSEDDFINNISRYGNLVPITILSFNASGKLSIVHEIKNKINYKVNNLEGRLVKNGLNYLAHKNTVIEQSPPGSSFVKPSKNELTEFIAAHRLAQSYSECIFLSFCILYKVNNFLKYDKIYIDTSAISHIILSTINLAKRLSENAKLETLFESFHSYSGIENIKPALGQKTLVIVSASSSNNMANEIFDKHSSRLSRDDVITLLSFTSSDYVLCCIKKSHQEKKANIERYVKRVDEYFTIENAEPKSVLIGPRIQIISAPLMVKR
tara:strand:+ start:258 stop:1235 length:978 start_codon:yes stop_codon:yes gene_type:complete